MDRTIWKLENTIKYYDWGSKDAITKLFGIKNPTDKPMAEVWMGDHPLGSSIAIDKTHQPIKLDKLIENSPLATLGEATFKTFAGLPFLFKILSASKALSIQVHPTQASAKLGFEKENQFGIALNSPNRNYKDANHKPELIYALTPFKAMRSFRPIAQIVALFEQLALPSLSEQVAQLKNSPCPEQLKCFFQFLLTLAGDNKQTVISELLSSITPLIKEPFITIKQLAKDFPGDIGIIMPLLLNIIELKPGQAMFLAAQTPHAYLSGTGLELMANSDNVLRAGLTHKHIDITELINNTSFVSTQADQLLIQPVINQNKIDYPVPVKDFKFEIIQSDNQTREDQVSSPQILLCLHGVVSLSTASDTITLAKGESAFIAYQAQQYTYQGEGILAKAFN